jgi:ABC-2 type transport system permease protein
MKVIDIALKDIVRGFRSIFFPVFGFGVPLLATALFFFAFGGVGSDEGFDLAAIQVQVVNQDQPGMQYGGFAAGQMLVDLLESPELGELVQITEATDPAAARQAVDMQQAGVALIIPDGFTEAMVGQGGASSIELYKDPTLTLGPDIVRGIISQLVDGFAGTQIAGSVVYDQLTERGIDVDDELILQIAMEYGEWSRSLGQTQQGGSNVLVETRAPADTVEETDVQKRVLTMIMAGMMVFYAFFTGASASMSILQEEEGGTLSRLFTTPTPTSSILAGKLVASFLLIIIQVVVLVVVSALVFGINWGEPPSVAAATVGLVVVAAGFGVFITSLLKNTKQTGVVYGGVMTVLGMIGMLGVFTGNFSPGSTITTISLFVPQGWAIYSWLLAQNQGSFTEVLLPAGVSVAIGAVLFVIGVLKFRKRFA